MLLKNKIQQNKSEDLTGFLKQFTNGVASTRRVLRRVEKWKVFIGRRLGRGATSRGKAKTSFFGVGEEQEGVLCRSPLSVGMERAQVTDYLIGGDQKIPDWLIKILFLGEVRTAVTSRRFDIQGLLA